MKYILIIFLFTSCSHNLYTSKPTLAETQKMHQEQKHIMQRKQIPLIVFSTITVGIFSYMYVMNNNTIK